MSLSARAFIYWPRALTAERHRKDCGEVRGSGGRLKLGQGQAGVSGGFEVGVGALPNLHGLEEMLAGGVVASHVFVGEPQHRMEKGLGWFLAQT